MRHPLTSKIAEEAFAASGAKTHAEFVALFGNAIALRTFRRWLAGDGPMDSLTKLVLRNFIAGWRPKIDA